LQKHKVQNQNNIKENNCKLVLNLIRDNQDSFISRADIAKITRMSATSITRFTDLLSEIGLVEQAESVINGSVGRNGIRLKVVEDAVLTAGISIDSDYIEVCLLNFVDRIIASRKLELEKRVYLPEEIMDIANTVFQQLCRDAGYPEDKIVSIGIACIGNVDYKSGTVYFAPQFQWKNVELGKIASKIFEQPIFIDNDLKSSIVGLTHRNKEIRHEDVTYLSIGMGVGSAVMYKGTLLRGSNNAAGEVGHVILESDGRPCDCGQIGCVQTYLTKNSLIELCQEEGRGITKVEQIYEAYRNKEEWAEKFVNRQAEHMAMLIRNLVYMYDTKYVFVGGAIISDFPEVFDLTEKKVESLLHENLYVNLNLNKVEGKNNSGIGAAFVAQERWLDQLLF